MCFSSFKRIRENYKVTKEANKQVDSSRQPSLEVVQNVVCNIEPFFSPPSPLPSTIQFENVGETMEHEEFIKYHAISSEPIHNRLQQLPHICSDLVGNYLDEFCS